MYLKSCCALFLLALVACQAAPSFEKLSNEAETFAKSDIKLEGTGAEKDRAKKSATTFCVEVRSGKPEQVPCRPEVRPSGIIQQEKPLVILQPIPVPAPAPIIEYPKQPIVIQQQPQSQPQQQSQPSQGFNLIQQQQLSTNVNYPQNTHTHHQIPQPAPQQVASVPAPAPPQMPIINIVPPAPASVPCDKPTQQPQIHTVHVIHPQLQTTSRPSFQEVKPIKEVKPQFLPIPQQKLTFLEPRPTICKKCNGVIQSQRPLGLIVQPSSIIDVPQYGQDNCRTEEETYECSCRQENRIPTPYSRFTKIQDPRIAHPSGATFNSMPYRSSMISTESDSNIMSNQPMIFEGTREMEGRHHKKHYIPLNFNVQFPVIRGSDDIPKYYQQSYAPSYFNPTYSYTLPSPYGSYGTTYGSYGTTYPIGYDGQSSASNPVIVNAGGPFYGRESQHIDSSQSNDGDSSKEALLSTATEINDVSNNQKRETNIIQLKNEQNEIARTEKENINSGNSVN